ISNRNVTLTSKVQDGQVIAATGNLGRLEVAAQNVGKGGAPNIKAVTTEVQKLDQATVLAALKAGTTYQEMAAKIKAASSAAKSAGTGFKEADKAISATADAAKGLEDASSSAGPALAALGTKGGLIGLAIAAAVVVMVGAVLV